MKPRIWRWHGIWHCATVPSADAFHVTCGLGYTPAQAWIDWKLLTGKHG